MLSRLETLSLDRATAWAGARFKSSAAEAFDVYATIEARKILEERAKADSLPMSVRRMLAHAGKNQPPSGQRRPG